MPRSLICGLALSFLASAPLWAVGQVRTETRKIEFLIKHVEELKDTKFVRNGVEYDAKTAARSLRGKWQSNKAKIKTAQDFIEHAASRSSTSGESYLFAIQRRQRKKKQGLPPLGT